LRFFDDDGAALQQASGKCFPSLLCVVFSGCFDECKAAWPTGFPIKRHTNASQRDSFIDEGVSQLLLRYVVREVPNEKTGTHDRSCL
jgi:hypothetical protein